jgi:hypothetical protein
MGALPFFLARRVVFFPFFLARRVIESLLRDVVCNRCIIYGSGAFEDTLLGAITGMVFRSMNDGCQMLDSLTHSQPSSNSGRTGNSLMPINTEY